MTTNQKSIKMTTNQKRNLSLQINKILDSNNFYRVGGSWTLNRLHIGVQPRGLFSSGFNDSVANVNFEKCIRQIKKLDNVKVANSREWCSGWKSLAGIELAI